MRSFIAKPKAALQPANAVDSGAFRSTDSRQLTHAKPASLHPIANLAARPSERNPKQLPPASGLKGASALLPCDRSQGTEALARWSPCEMSVAKNSDFAPGDETAEQLGDRSADTELPNSGHEISRPLTPSRGMEAIPAKLAISAPGDRYEQEADRLAAEAMQTPEPQGEPNHSNSRAARGLCELRPIDFRRPATTPSETIDVPSSLLDTVRSAGQALDPVTRTSMEIRFGHDFSRIRVHTDAAAQQSALDLDARAYTIGQNIVFGAGQLTPGTCAGQQLLAHELSHTLQQSSGAPLRIARQSTDPRHQRGFAGEQGMGFVLYRQEDGWILFEGPSGAAGHGVTQKGFDGVAYNTRSGEIHIIDNKSLARPGNVGSATAIDPSRNLSQNLDGLIQRVEAAKDVPGRIRLLGRLRTLKASLVAGKPLPSDVKLVVTGEGGRAAGVTGRLQSQGIEFRAQPTPKNQPVSKPAPVVPVETPQTASPAPKPAPPKVTSTPIVEGESVPVVTPAARPVSAWRAGLKAGGKALLVTLAFAGLEYLVHKKLEKDLEASIEMAKRGAMPWAQRIKRNDPTKPVYMSVKIESKEYSTFIPLLGWMPDSPVLQMLSIEMTQQLIDPPVVQVQDHRLNPWHPGVTTTVTYSELMVP